MQFRARNQRGIDGRTCSSISPSIWLAVLCFALASIRTNAEELAAPRERGTPDERPNLVVFLVDDMGWQDTSVPFHTERTPFNGHFRTPNMERLAAQGRKFTQAYSCAVCSPTRTSIMTGQNAARHQVTNWTLRKDGETSGKTERLDPPSDWRRNGLQPGDVTLPGLLQRVGYRTIHGGKAHWGTHDTPGCDPTTLGFDVNIAGHAAGGPGHYHGMQNFGNKSPGEYTKPWGVPGLEKYHGTPTHLTDATTQEALSAVRAAVAKDRPFYLYLAHYAIHAPLQPHEPYAENYRGKTYPSTEIPIPTAEVNYASMVEGMDASLGQVLALLDELGVAENTLVVFTSDNGGLSAHARGKTPMNTGVNTHNRPLRAGKGSAYEGGTRVPMIVSWARPAAQNTLQQATPVSQGTSSQVTIIEDLFPTLLHVAGAWTELPEEHAITVDGLDQRAALAGTDSPRSSPLIFHYPHVWSAGFLTMGEGYEPHSAIRDDDLKAIYFYDSNRWELYDLANDLAEQHDLVDERPEDLRRLAARLLDELERRDARWPRSRETGEEVKLRLPGLER